MTQKGNEKFDQKPNRGFQIRTQKRETLSPAGNKFTIFVCVCVCVCVCADMETTTLFLPKLFFLALQRHKMKLL